MKTLYTLLGSMTLICCLFINTLNAQTAEMDSLALVDLYNNCGGENWSGFDTWLNGPISTWEKVTVDSASQRVTNVEFKEMAIVGTLPATLGNMDQMSGKIEFRDDDLSGEMPSFFWKWVNVERFQMKFAGYTSINTDGIENMVNLTEFNTEGTPIAGMAPGAIFTLPSMVKIYLHDTEIDALPPEFSQSSGLDRFYANGTNLTGMPDLSGVVWKDGAKVRFQNNHLTFEDLMPNVSLLEDPLVAEFIYSPQATVGESSNMFPAAGSEVQLIAGVGGMGNTYTWVRGGDEVVDETDTYTIAAFDENTHSGEYFAIVQNANVPGLDIMTGTTALYGSVSSMDSLALVDLYNDCGGSEWSGFDTWLNGPISTWEKVTVDSASQRVTNVEFKEMAIVGTLPATLGNMDQMSGKIEFRDDDLSGEMPSFFWNWVNVERFQMKFAGYTSINTDGIENMVNLTEFNTEGTPIAGMAPGEIFTLPAMVKIYLHDNNLDALPPELAQSTGLDRFYANGNNLTEMPDMSGVVWKDGAKVRFQNNHLTFEDLMPNVSLLEDPLVAEFIYSPQATVGESINMFPAAGSEVQLTAGVGGMGNTYTWVRGGDEVVDETDTYTIAAFDENIHSGEYFALVQNANVPGLDIITGTTALYGSMSSMDSLALVDLYNDCGGTEWSGFDTWLNGPISTWEKVTVDSASQRVTNVEFKEMAIVGTLPSTLGNMDQMSGKIEFRDDDLSGEMPSFFWNWVNVERFQMKFAGYTSINTDGIENMVNLTEFNTEGTPIAGMAPGEIFTLPAMVKIYLHDNNLDALPPELSQSTGLDRFYANGNNLAEIPDMSGVVWKDGAKVRFQNNHLTFEDLMPNVSLLEDPLVAEFIYSPQATVGESTKMFPAPGSEVQLTAGVGGMGNTYTWVRGVDEVVDETETYTIASFDQNIHSGDYYALVQNANVPGLDIITGTTGLYNSAPSMDSLALVNLYNDCGGSEWEGFDMWLNGPLGTWERVTVDSVSQRVTNVEFKDMNLVGTLPSSLGNMDQMSGKIEFRDDTLLVGAVPSFLWKWVNVDRFQMKFSGYTSIDTDGIENMVNLTEFNTEGSPMTGMIPGVLFTLPSMVKLYFHDCEFDALPAELTSVSGLDRLYLNGDNFTDLPDLSGVVWADGAKIRVQDNQFTFEDLEYNMPLTTDILVEEFNYSPQANIVIGESIDLIEGDTLRLSSEVGGSANMYTWILGGDTPIDGATEADFQIDGVVVADSGDYSFLAQSALVPGLDIFGDSVTVTVTPIVGLDEIDFNGLKVLGNPVVERVEITSNEVIQNMFLYDLNGRLVNQKININDTNISMNVSGLNSGIYLLVVSNDVKYQTIKVVKE